MATATLQHRRTHNLLLISKLLGQRDAASPFTLVLDSLEQSGKGLIAEYTRRAKAAKVEVIFLSFETLKKPCNTDHFVSAWSQSLQAWQKEISSLTRTTSGKKQILIIDSLNALAATQPGNIPGVLSTLIGPSTPLLAIYHTDVPTPPSSNPQDAYSPDPLSLLRYLATTIFVTHNLSHVLSRKSARDRSKAEPLFGLEEGVEGVLQSVEANGSDGMVLEMEHRRKSGRGVREWYFLPSQRDRQTSSREVVTLLEDHPSYRNKPSEESSADADEPGDTTFELGLTEKQRRDREGIVLPYSDAQKGEFEGGRILYDMGSEDDFDEEEDEI